MEGWVSLCGKEGRTNIRISAKPCDQKEQLPRIQQNSWVNSFAKQNYYKMIPQTFEVNWNKNFYIV